MDIAVLERLIGSLGFPVVLTIGLVGVIYHAGKRLVDEHVKFLSHSAEMMERMGEKMERITIAQEKVVGRIDDICRFKKNGP